MLVIIIAALLVLGIAFFQAVQGVFSALIMTCLSLLAAVAAMGWYAPLGERLYPYQPESAGAIVLLALFFIPLFVAREVLDRALKANVVFGLWVDRIVGGALGLVTGMVLVGVLTVAAQMLPFGRSVLGYSPFAATLEKQSSLAPFVPDRFVIGLTTLASDGSLAGARRFGQDHPDLLRELYCARNTAGANGWTGLVSEGGPKLEGAYAPPPGMLSGVKPHAPAPTSPKTWVVRVTFSKASVEPEGSGKEGAAANWWFIPGTHLRLRTQDNRDVYPSAYLVQAEGQVRVVNPPSEPWFEDDEDEDRDARRRNLDDEEDLAPAANLLVQREREEKDQTLTVDWVFLVPAEAKPARLIFRRAVELDVPAPVDGTHPPLEGMLEGKKVIRGKVESWR